VYSFTPSGPSRILDSGEGTVILWFPASGICAAWCVGHITGEHTRGVYELVDAQPAPPPEGFIDMTEMTSFDWEARGRVLRWNLLHLGPRMQLHIRVASAPMLIASKVFERALRGHVEIHREEGSFTSAYSLAIKRRSRAYSSEPPPRL
jgi:hypothetical protein